MLPVYCSGILYFMSLKVNRIAFALLLLAVVMGQSEPSAASNDPVIISYVSTVIDSTSSSLAGSTQGGTALYIHGLGFDPTSSNNQIFVGDFPCDTSAKGVTLDTITCDTTAATSNVVSNLPITVLVKGKNAAICSSSSCAFTYSGSSTPSLRSIFPRSASGGNILKWYGIHRIIDLGIDGRTITDVRGLYIGSQMCSRFDIMEANINANSYQYITCQLPPTMEGGLYNVTEWVTPGYAQKSPRMLSGSISQGVNYEYAVIPAITSISANSGSYLGALLTITGTGFSSNVSKLSIKAANIPCDVKSASATSITCQVQPNFAGNTFGILGTNSTNSTPSDPWANYIQGSGFAFRRLNITDLPSKTIPDLINELKITPHSSRIPVLQQGTTTDLRTADVYPAPYANTYAGYFRAPTTGNYIFRAIADDSIQVFLSPTYGRDFPTISSTSTPIISSTTYSQSADNYYVTNAPTMTSDPIALNAGDYHWMEVYHMNSGGNGYMMVSVEVPNTNDTHANTVYEVQNLSIAVESDPEIFKFTIANANAGSFNLRLIRKNSKTNAIIYDVNYTVSYTITADAFTTLIKKFDIFNGHTISTAITCSDAAGVAAACPSVNKDITVTVFTYRPESSTTQTFTITTTDLVAIAADTPTVTYTRLQEHSPPISGSYKLSLNNTLLAFWNSTSNAIQTDIPYNTKDWELQSYMSQSWGCKTVEVNQAIGGSFLDGISFIVSWVGCKGNQDLITTDATLMLGGKAGTAPTVTATEIRAGSTNLFFEPISHQLMFSPVSAPQVTVTVGGVLSKCNSSGACSYNLVNTGLPVLETATYNVATGQLTLNISGTVTIADLTYSIDNQPCSFVSGTTSDNIVCVVPKNSDTTGQIHAGEYTPVVMIRNIGIIPTGSSFVPVTVPLVLNATGPSPVDAPKSGGVPVKLKGHGYPYSLTDGALTVTICGKTAKVTAVNNIEITVLAPSCTADLLPTNAVISYKSLTASIPFSYNMALTAPVITSIEPTSASPVLKGFLQINGSDFGTNVADLTAYLTNSTGRIYQLNVLEAADTSIKVRLPGGESGVFNVVVNRVGLGDSVDVATFKYEIVVTSVSPTTGSANGGTRLTITGRNFSPDPASNQVAIGDALNNWCLILTASATEITCVTPVLNEQYTNPEQKVIVVGRAMIDSTCEGNCNFTYADPTTTPTITPPTSSNFVAGQNYTLDGANLGTGAKVFVGSVEATVTASSATSVTFTYPALVTGNYPLNVLVNGFGYATPTINSFTPITASGLSNTTGSRIGNIITINGNGFVPQTDVNFNVTITRLGAAVPFTVVSSTPTAITLKVGGGSDNNTFSVSHIYKGTTSSYNYSVFSISTPKVALTGSTSIAYSAGLSLTFNRTSLISDAPSTIAAIPLTTTNTRFSADIPLTITSVSPTNSTFVVDASVLGAGKYNFSIYYPKYGYADISSNLEILAGTTTAASVTSSYLGGKLITVSGTGLSQSSQLDVAGVQAKLVSGNSNALIYEVPPYVTKLSQTTYNLAEPRPLTGTLIADTLSAAPLASDGLLSTIYSSSAATCYVGVDFGEYLRADITRIRYFPNRSWRAANAYILGATITASNDGTTWSTLFTVDSSVHTGWNIWRPSAALTTTYRYVRFEHNSTSKCQLGEFEVSGLLYAGVITDVTVNTADVHFTDGFHPVTWAGKVTYRDDATPVVTALTPTTGSPTGNTVVTLTGTGFGTDPTQVSIFVDGIACVAQTATGTQITCLTGARPTLPTANTFDVSINQNRAAIKVGNFTYANRWSDPNTWGGDIPPVSGDTVYVPAGMVLLVDQSTPNLKTIIVDGSIVFADEDDYIIETGSITVRFGSFQAGTEKKPYQHQLTFLLHGGYYDKQLPGMGNKGIGCHACKFDMHGKPIVNTWTELDATADVGATSITVRGAIDDWKVGDMFVVASTSFVHEEAERREITAIDKVNKVITFEEPLAFKHVSVVDDYGTTDKLPIRAQVALLTRNILVTGDAESVSTNYGAHIIMHGPAEDGLVSHIAYIEATKCGQPAIVGRYCIHFHMNGDVFDSYVIGNSVHDSFARVLTIHATHFLTVQKNVGYLIHGHSIFLEDGMETYNVIEHNCIIGTIQVWNMLQTDISSASYWITNPLNTVRYNRACGSDFYGFWYEIKEHPDGPSATSDICPQSLPLIESHDNIAHSNRRFGLRIFKLFSSTYPCQKIRNDNLLDPWSANPSIQNIFYNYVLYRNDEAGLLAEEMGNTIFRNFTIADSGVTNVQFHQTNYTKELVIAEDFAIIGQSNGNGPSNAKINGVFGLISPRTDGFKGSNLRFYNYPATTTVFHSCSVCENELVRATTGKTSFFENIKYTNVTGNYIFWNFPRRELYIDLDGSLTNTVYDGTTRAKASVSPYYVHNEIPGKCGNATNQAKWSDSIVCNADTPMKTAMMTNGIPASWFQNTQIHFFRLSTPDEDLTALSSNYSGIWVVKAMKDKPQGWGSPFALGYTYNVWWNFGIDFTHMAVVPSVYFTDTEPGLLFRFNYTETRELFEITQMVSGTLQLPLIEQSLSLPDINTCNAGDYYHDNTNRYLYVCVSGRNKPVNTYLDLNGIKCRYLCPQPEGEFTKENFTRLWSNATQWPNEVLPQEGDNVTVSGNWTLIMDVSPPRLNNLTINGDVFVADKDTVIKANFIWIRAGSLHAGNSSVPFKYKLDIILYGEKSDRSFVVDPSVAGNKYLVVTGMLSLYGQAPGSIWTRLTGKAAAGATEITVASTSDWVVGDQLGIAPSFNNPSEYEKVTITAISGNTVTFTPALNYTHYGEANPSISNTYGTLDMRSGVAHLTRSIRIIRAADEHGWGFRVLVYGFMDGERNRLGTVTLKAVEFVEGGQYDTDYAALQFLDTASNPTTSLVDSCSFHDCGGYCVRLQNNANVTINNNNFYLARKFIVSVEGQYDYKFTNNLMIGARSRVSMQGAVLGDEIACYQQYKPVDMAVDNNLVQNNLCQGSELEGFVFPFIPCQFIGLGNVGFIDNTAGSTIIGFMFNVIPGDCIGGERIRAYSNEIGYLCNPLGPSMAKYDNFLLADNGRGMGLRNGNAVAGGDNNTAVLTDSWISAVSRPNCDYCYGTGKTKCSGNHGIRLLTSSANGQSLPLKFGTGFDVVCKNELYDAKAFLTNVTFDNFRVTYSGNLSSCTKNSVFKPHPAAFDLTGSHHLTACPCVNCETGALAWFSPPPETRLDWFGGCGKLLCTGMNNYIIQDHDGSFLGFQGTMLANNSDIGDNEFGCVANSDINGHICQRSDFGVLEYESIAPDFNARIMWPVQLKYWGGNWTTYTNGYREWEWDGPEPLNKRLARFISTIRLNQTYNMSFEAQPPSDMRFQIQQRTWQGNPNDWVAVRIYYPVANAISVFVKTNPRKPVTSILSTSDLDVTNFTSQCGANKYFYRNGTVAVLITGEKFCQVRVSLNSNVQITSRLMVDIDTFFNNGGVATFVDRMCAFLEISTDRLKVVGVYAGSTIIDSYVTPEMNTTAENSTTTPKNIAQETAELNAIAARISSAAPSSIDLGPLGTVASTSATVNIVNTDGSLYTNENTNNESASNKTTIIIAVVVSVLSAALVGVTTYLVVKKLRNRDRIEPEESAERSDVDISVHKEKEAIKGTELEFGERDLNENKSQVRLE